MRWPPTEPAARRAAKAVIATGVALLAVAVALDARVVAQPWIIVTEVSFVLGALIVLRRPTHAIGWLFLWYGAIVHLTFVLFALATALAPEAPRPAAWLEATGWALNTAVTALYVPLGLLLFPTGRLPGRRWGWVAVVCVLGAVVGGGAALLVGAWGGAAADVVRDSPLRARAGGVGETLSDAFFPLLLVAWAASAVSLLLRVRRARGEERQQLRLLGLGAGYALLVLVPLAFATSGGQAVDLIAETLLASAMAAVPVAAGVAVLRYRLWGIDLVIRRTVVVGLLAAFVTGVYVLVVVGVGALLPVEDVVLSVAATALVAVVFAPLRERVSQLANRVAYGRRATPFEVLADLSERMAGALPEERLLEVMARRLAEGTGAERASVWLRAGDWLEPVAGWPAVPDSPAVPVGADGEVPLVPGAEDVTPVLHRGRLLGALAVNTGRGEGLVPAERSLVADLAESAGLVLRKSALNRDLRGRVVELAASRRRVVAAEDAIRRRLERDLHDGAQQQLVALRVQLGLARTLASKEGADSLLGRLEALSSIAEETVDAVRGVAHGIYPPLLAAEGLPAALRAAARRAPLPVALEVQDGIGRYPEPVEAAVYFAAVAALDAAARGGATSATLDARLEDHRLALTVRTDAALPAGLLAAPRDRLDTVNGWLKLAASPEGSVVTASAPTADAAAAPDRPAAAAVAAGVAP